MCGVYASVRSCGTPLTGRGGFILAISMRVLFALLFIPKHPGPCVQTARPKVAATHVLQGWAIEGDVSSPSSQFALFSAEDRTAMNRRWFDARLLTDEAQQFSNSPQKQTPPTQHAEARHALHRQSANLLTLSTRQRAHYANRHTSDKRDENYTTGYVNTPTPHANMIIPPHSENITPTLTPTPPPPTSPSRSSNEQMTHYDYTSRKPTPSKQNPHN